MWRHTLLCLGIAALLQASGGAANQAPAATDDLSARAAAAIRGGRPVEAISLLEPTARQAGAAPTTRLLYVVALIAAERLEGADTEIAGMEATGAVSPAQLQLLKSSVSKIRAARTRAADLAPLIAKGDIRAALRRLEADPSTDAGDVFARSYLFRLLGEFDSAAKILTEAANRSPGEVADQFIRAADTIQRQQTVFADDTALFQALIFRYDGDPQGECGSEFSRRASERYECLRALVNTTSRVAQDIADTAPFSAAAASARLVQAIWFGKDVEARAIVRSTRLNHASLEIPSLMAASGDWPTGWLTFHFDTKDLEWTDFKTPGSGPSVPRKKNSKFLLNGTRIPFSKIRQFDQHLDLGYLKDNTGFPLIVKRELVAADTSAGRFGGVPQAESVALIFGEIPLRLAMRTYGHVIAECLAIPEGKYSLVGEKPSRMGGLLYGLAYGAVAGVATAQGNSGVRTEALQNSGSQLKERSVAVRNDASVAAMWKQEMGSVKLGIENRTMQAEVASLLSGSMVPIGAQPRVPHALEGTWREPANSGAANARTRFAAAPSVLVVRSEDGELRGTLNTDVTFTGELQFRASRQLEFRIDTSGPKPSAQLVSAKYTEDGRRRPGAGFILKRFELIGQTLMLDFDYGLLGLGENGVTKVEMELSR